MTQQTTINFSRELTNAGIQKAIDTANRVHDAWEVSAYNYLVEFVKTRKDGEIFMCEDIREDSQTMVKEPPSNRAWGGIMRLAIKNGVIKRVGIMSVSNPKAHRANAAIYIKNI